MALRQLRQGAEFGLGLVVLLPIRLAMLAALDDSVGRVVAAWKAAGLYDNSVIVFQSDK